MSAPAAVIARDAWTLVTGVNGCIGAEVAARRLAADERVFGIDISPARLDGPNYAHLQCDLASAKGLAALLAEVESTNIPIAAFISCAGVYERSAPVALEYDAIMRTLAINVAAYVHLGTRLALKAIRPGGHIVGIASDAAVLGPRNGIDYAASKGAIVSATYAMARAFADRPVLVNCVVPGVVDSPQARLDSEPGRRAKFEREIPLGRVGRASDVARVIDAITSGAFDYCTGQKFAVNGGRNLL